MLGSQHAEIRYRSKRNSKSARDFSVTLPNDPNSAAVRMLGLFGFLWINHVGRLTCCLYCNDLFADSADAAFMDAWLPEYIPDVRGTSLVISRNAELSAMFETMFRDGTLQGGTIPPERICESQEAMIEERRLYSRIFTNILSHERGTASPAASEKLFWRQRETIVSRTRSCTVEEVRWARRYLAFHSDMRKLLRYYSHRLARKPNWYSRFYVIRLFWLTFLSLVRHRLLKKTLQSLHFLKKRKPPD